MKDLTKTTFGSVKKGDLFNDVEYNRTLLVVDVETSKAGRIKITFQGENENGEYKFKNGFCSPNTLIRQ